MSRSQRTLPQGEGSKLQVALTASSSLGPIQIPNYGVTDLTALTTAADYVLDAPVEGVLKHIVHTSSVAQSWVVKASTGSTVKIGGQGLSQITFAGTVDQAVSLLGINSTRWVVYNTIGSPTIA